jgi:trehalose 6-phosphate phosphatase
MAPDSTDLPAPAPDWALFLDFDGTLVDIAPQPDAVRVTPGLPELLQRLHQALDGAVAVISGRAIDDIDRWLSPARLPAAGQHGLEQRRTLDELTRAAVDQEALATICADLERFAADHPGTRLEPKGMTVALHYRNAPEAESDARAIVASLMERHGDGFHVQEGKMVLEVKPKGSTKGTVVEQFLTEPPFAGRMPVFIGDDVTDEDGFIVANRHGGISIQVGTRLPTDATSRIASVTDLHRWLALAAESLTGASDIRRDG